MVVIRARERKIVAIVKITGCIIQCSSPIQRIGCGKVSISIGLLVPPTFVSIEIRLVQVLIFLRGLPEKRPQDDVQAIFPSVPVP
jgi:hypothetical protein